MWFEVAATKSNEAVVQAQFNYVISSRQEIKTFTHGEGVCV
jgi:hypothetical protein